MYISLKAKIWIFVNVFVLSITVFTYFYFPSREYQYHFDVYNKELDYLARTISTGVSVALSDGNYQGIQAALEYAKSDSRLKFVAMVQVDSFNAEGLKVGDGVLFRVFPENFKISPDVQSTDDVIVKRATFMSDFMAGEVIVGFSTSEIVLNVQHLQKNILITGVFIMIISSFLSLIISTTITRPLKQLRDASHKIGAGNLDFNLKVRMNDELGELVTAFDKMVRELDKSRNNIRQQKEELERANSDLHTINDEKNNLISILSHDLRSPLNQIKGLLGLIKLQYPPVMIERLDVMAQAERCIERMNEMIIKILDVESLEMGRISLKMEKHNLESILIEVSENFRAVAAKKSINLTLDVQRFEYFIDADRHYTTLIFENLLSNAIKFSPKNSTVNVEIMNGKGDGFVTVKIHDEGPGISKDDQMKLFHKYQRLGPRPTAGESSIGLGLSIVKKYLDVMGGHVFYENRKAGSTFVVKLRKHMEQVEAGR